MKTFDLETSLVKTAYARWAPIYDVICGPAMVKGRRAAAAAAFAVGGRFSRSGGRHGTVVQRLRCLDGDHGHRSEFADAGKGPPGMASGCHPHIEAVHLMDAHAMTFAVRDLRLRRRPIRYHAGRQSRAAVVRMPSRGEPGGRIILVNHLYR